MTIEVAATPLWRQVADQILAEIEDGRMLPGARIPAERELCERLGISRVTLRRALARLVEEGVLESSHGRGWFVARSAKGRSEWPNSLESFSETAQRMGLSASSRVLRAQTDPATLDEAEELSIAPGSPVFHLDRVRLLGGVAIAVDDSCVPADLVPGIDQLDFRTASLYGELARAGLDLARAESTIEAREADARLSDHLAIDLGKPVLVMRQVVVDAGDRPMFTSRIRYAGDRYRLRTSFTRHQPAQSRRSEPA